MLPNGTERTAGPPDRRNAGAPTGPVTRPGFGVRSAGTAGRWPPNDTPGECSTAADWVTVATYGDVTVSSLCRTPSPPEVSRDCCRRPHHVPDRPAPRARAGRRGEPRAPPQGGQGVDAPRVRPVERRAQLRRRPRRRGLGAGAVEGVRRRADQPDRQPAHRGQPAQLPPRDRDRLRPGRRVGHLGAPVDRRGGPARHRDPRLPAGDPRRRPGRPRAGPDDAHGCRLRVGQPRRPAAVAGLRLLPGARDPHLAPQHRQDHPRPGRRAAARPDLAGREPAHALLPEPARCRARGRARTRRCGPSPRS